MSRKFLVSLLILVLLNAFTVVLQITPVRAQLPVHSIDAGEHFATIQEELNHADVVETELGLDTHLGGRVERVSASSDVLFVAWKHPLSLYDPLPDDERCEWIIEKPDGTPLTFTGNQHTEHGLPTGTYDIKVEWEHMVVRHFKWTKNNGDHICDAPTSVTDVNFTATDDTGEKLYYGLGGPCWEIIYPDGSSHYYYGSSITRTLANETYNIRVKWQGKYVAVNGTGSLSWDKTVETSVTVKCWIADRTFTAIDKGGNQLWPDATKMWVRVPNRTWYYTDSSSFTLMKVGNGTYAMNVTFGGSKVFGEKSYNLVNIPEHIDFTIPCEVYSYSPVLRDQNGVAYPGANITLRCPNGTTAFLITDSNGRVTIPQIQNGSYSIPDVIYNGHRVNQTDPFFIEDDLTDWLIQFNGLSINQTDYPAAVHLNSTFTIRAKLVYSYSGKPISGGKVGLLGASWLNATTDASGWATFSDLSEWQPVGPFTVFGINDSDYGLTYRVHNESMSMTWTGDFDIQVLDDEGFALNNASLLVYNGTDAYWKTVNTDSTGFVHVQDAVCQDYVVNVAWKGVNVGSVSFDLNRAVIDKTVSCTVYYGYVGVSNLTASPIEDVPVDILWPSGDLYETHQTNETGFTPLISQIPGGTYTVKITYSNATYKASVEVDDRFEFQYKIAAVSIPGVPGVEFFIYSTDSTVNAIRYNQIFSEVNIEVTGPSGSEGYFNIFVPKAFLSNFDLTIDDVHVFLDDIPLECSYTECTDGYLLATSYQHSSHTIEVVFSDITLSASFKDGNSVGLIDAYIELYRDDYLLKSGYTDENGDLSLTKLPTGNYTIHTYWRGILVKTDELTITGDESYSVICPVYDITVQVLDIIPSSLPGASVTASLTNGTVLFSGTTDTAGNVTFYQAPATEYEVRAIYFGASSSTTIVLTQNLAIQICLPMLNMMTLVLIVFAIGTVATLIGVHYSKRGEEKPKRGRGRPRKVKPSI